MKFEKQFFYAGKTGGEPMEIWYICVFGDVVIASAYNIFLFMKKHDFLRSICEIVFISLSLYFLVYTQSALFILFLFLMPNIFGFKGNKKEKLKSSHTKGKTEKQSFNDIKTQFSLKLSEKEETKENQENSYQQRKRSGSLAITKLDVLFLTAVCIIFVDFQYFPSRFFKVSHGYGFINGPNNTLLFVKSENTKKFGKCESNENVFLSLMDTGAAYFVILNGFSSLKPKNSIIDCVVNFLLWLVRRITTEATNYYTPEGEYSPGCNFSGYISIVQFFAFLSSSFKIPSFLMLLVTMLIHEFTQCKFPILGYISLFYMANVVKYYPVKHFWFHYFLCIFIILLSSFGVFEPLRETANTPFSLIVLAILCCTLDINDHFHIEYESLSSFMRSIDRHSLIYFLICNIFTGIINLLTDTNNTSKIVCFLSVNLTFIFASILTIFYDLLKSKCLK